MEAFKSILGTSVYACVCSDLISMALEIVINKTHEHTTDACSVLGGQKDLITPCTYTVVFNPLGNDWDEDSRVWMALRHAFSTYVQAKHMVDNMQCALRNSGLTSLEEEKRHLHA